MSIRQKDVSPLLPYISDTGNYPPASCVFTLTLSIGAACVARRAPNSILLFVQFTARGP